MSWIFLATEDELSERVGIRLAAEAGLEVGQCLRRNGFGYLKSRVGNFCQMAKQAPVFLITDLDQKKCANALITEWSGKFHRPENFLFRVAVREVESWLLADEVGIQHLLGRKSPVPSRPDELFDPKKTLLSLAQHAPKAIRDELVAQRGAVAGQGIGYNALLGEWVNDMWQPQRAAERSPSLSRTLIRLRELSNRINN